MSIKHSKTSNGNKHRIEMSTRRKGVSTSNLSTSTDRTDIKIPKNSKIYEYLYVDTAQINAPKWELLDALLEVAQRTKEDNAIKIYDVFINSMSTLYPDKKAALDKLRPLILQAILKGSKLHESYYQDLKEL